MEEDRQNLIDENYLLQQALSDADIAGKNAVFVIEGLRGEIGALRRRLQSRYPSKKISK